MAGKTIPGATEPRDGGIDWDSVAEAPPSTVRSEEPRAVRWAGSLGLLLVALAGFLQFFSQFAAPERPPLFGPGSRVILFAAGLACMLLHASRDPDLQIRRTYGMLGFLLLAAAIVLSAIPVPNPAPGQSPTYFLPYGLLCLPLALLFLMAFARQETEPAWRRAAVWAVGVTGVVLALTGVIGGNVSVEFLLPYGVALAVAGLAYWWAFVGMEGGASTIGYRAGLALGVVGAVVFLTALGRSAIPPALHAWGRLAARPEPYFTSSGLLLMYVGLAYVALSAGLCSDHRLVVLTRRELAAFFYSPIAYVVLFGLTLVGLYEFAIFVSRILFYAEQQQPLIEPVVRYYIIDFVPVVSVIVVVPVLTMRLLSEERRTGTLEVLLTAPVGETAVVVSKFLAAWVFFLLIWLPWALFLLALRIEGGQTFDYQPLLSFSIGLACSAAGFVAMGLFFSSLTRNQIAAAVLTAMGMMVLIGMYFIIQGLPPGSAWTPLLTHMSFIHLWQSNLQGKLFVRDLLFPLSATVFWLFLTAKVLEARKWA